jgi:tryptophan 2,3-dioxygenase
MATFETNKSDSGAETSFGDKMSYSDYLGLSEILAAQHPQSTAHDEMLFIVQHQTSELWMKLAIHEMVAARDAISNDQVQQSFKMLARLSRIFEQLNSAWDVLRTMTPSEYTIFRESLGKSSGFQSWQYRLIEFAIGNRNEALLKPHAHSSEITKVLSNELQKPSLYDAALALLVRRGFELPDEVINRDLATTHVPNDVVEEVWAEIYKNPEEHWQLYELAEKLVDIEDYFRRWRFNHVTTVERIIGSKRGSGGTSGVPYLRRMLDVVLFPELWQVRTRL